MAKILLPLLVLLTASTLAFADYEYRYIEGESFNRSETAGLRDEGFTSWMAHPSGGKVAVFGRPAGGFLEYDVKGLEAGDYYLYVRCLALSITKTHLLWDGKDLGLITHDVNSTSLRWSVPVKITGPGDHVLRLQGGDDATQWPYIDTILLTNQPGYVPPAKAADFVSFKTPWPLLQVASTPPLTEAPLPAKSTEGAVPPPYADVTVTGVKLAPPVVGANEVTVTLTAKTAQKLAVGAGFAYGHMVGWIRTEITLAPGQAQPVTLHPLASQAGEAQLFLSLGERQDQPFGCYAVTIPSPAKIALDESAYPSSQAGAKWTADFNCSPDLLARIKVTLAVRDLNSGKIVSDQASPAKEHLDLIVDLRKLPIGRYEATGKLLLDGQTMLEDRRAFITYKPSPFPAWEPIQTTKAVGDTILVNGKPFLGRLVYHMGASEKAREQGFNLVQCWGDMPDPLVQMTAHLDAAQKAGMYGSLALFNTPYVNKGAEFDLPHLERIINALRNHPALWGWDLIDEPEPTMKPEAVQAAADLIRKLDPNHIVWVNLCMNTRATDYLASQDLWSFDFYPFPTLSPFSYKKQWLNISDEKLLGKRAMGTVLQTFNYNHHEIRMPSPDELRTSAWLHVIHGYKWFGYYSYYDGEPSGSLSNTPELWSYCRALNTEMVQFADVILAPGQWQPVKMTPQTDKLEAREKQVGGKWYVVVVSDSKEPLQVTLTPTLAQGKRRLLIESDQVAVAGTTIETTVRPFATQVWELSR